MDIAQEVPNAQSAAPRKQPQSNSNPTVILRPPIFRTFQGPGSAIAARDENGVMRDKPRQLQSCIDVVMERPKRKAQRQAAATASNNKVNTTIAADPHSY
jgi:hypothetical protein